MLKKLMQSAAALALVAGIAAASSQPAEARRGVGAGVAIGTILGLGIAGAYAGPRYYYDDGPALLSRAEAVRLCRPQLLVQQLRRACVPGRRIPLLASDDLRLTCSARFGLARARRSAARRPLCFANECTADDVSS